MPETRPGNPLEECRRVSERDAPVSRTVIVTALETVAGVARKQRPGRHQLAAKTGPALKAARNHNGNPVRGVTFFKGAVARTGGADHILHGPAVPLRERANVETATCAVSLVLGQRLLQPGRNFRQESTPPGRYRPWTGGAETAGHFFRKAGLEWENWNVIIGEVVEAPDLVVVECRYSTHRQGARRAGLSPLEAPRR